MKQFFYILILSTIIILTGCSRVDTTKVLEQAYAATKNADFEEGIRLSNQCLSVMPESIDALLLNGYCHYQLLHLEEATYAYNKAAQLDENSFHAQYLYGSALVEEKDYISAIKPLEKSLALQKGHESLIEEVYILLIRCCLENNDYVKGFYYVNRLQAENPAYKKDITVLNALGLFNIMAEQYDAALVKFAEAHNLNSSTTKMEHAIVLQNIAVLYDMHLKNSEEALRIYRMALIASNLANDKDRGKMLRERYLQLSKARRSTVRPEN